MFIGLIFHHSKANRFYLFLFSYNDSWMLLSIIIGFLERRQFFCLCMLIMWIFCTRASSGFQCEWTHYICLFVYSTKQWPLHTIIHLSHVFLQYFVFYYFKYNCIYIYIYIYIYLIYNPPPRQGGTQKYFPSLTGCCIRRCIPVGRHGSADASWIEVTCQN